MSRSARHKLLADHGFVVVAHEGNWFRTRTPSNDDVVFWSPSLRRWHAFWCAFAGTGSGDSPEAALDGNLGDVIDSTAQLRAYCRGIAHAPEHIVRDCEGYFAALSQCALEFGD